MLMSDTRAWLEIDLSKISHNVKEIQKLLPSTSKIMAIVKANAYGHGDVACAKELSRCGIDFFGVSSVDEGISLREGGIREPILILGYTPPVHFHQVIQHDLLSCISLIILIQTITYTKVGENAIDCYMWQMINFFHFLDTVVLLLCYDAQT